MSTRLIFVRHGETDVNRSEAFCGWTDVKLSDKGHSQGIKVGDRLVKEHIDVLYSSPLIRAKTTAEYISNMVQLPIIESHGLKEINGGDWENLEFTKIRELYPDEHFTWRHAIHMHKMPNGENMRDFINRIISEVDRIVEENRNKTICIVTHGTVIKVLLCYYKDLGFEKMNEIIWSENTAVSIIDVFEQNKFDIIAENDVSHLNEDLYSLLNQGWYKRELKKREEGQKSLRDIM